MLHRVLLLVAVAATALALAAAPALAQDDDDDGGGGGAVPQGGVQTGAGGTASEGPDATLLGLATGSLLLVAGAGGLALRRRSEA
jgi:hypothetical protein